MKGSDTQVKKATRRIYLSLIFVTLSLLTMVATTFAWVGIVSNASFERITINLETDNEKSPYGVQLSLTGKQGDFHDSIEAIDLQRQILKNIGVPNEKLDSDSKVSVLFNSLGLAQCTTTKYSETSLNNFTNRNANEVPHCTVGNDESNYLGYFPFDIWLAIYKINDATLDNVDTSMEVFLREGSDGLITSNTSTVFIPNSIQFPTFTSEQSLDSSLSGKTIYGNVSIKAANAARLSIQKSSAVTLGKPEEFVNAYNKLDIFSSGSVDEPTYNQTNNLYDFGGAIDGNINFARLQYNSIHPDYDQLGDVPQAVINRGDKTFTDNGALNKIVNSGDMTTAQMIKFHFNFWIEGWDADCFEAIDSQWISVNLNFSTKKVGEH